MEQYRICYISRNYYNLTSAGNKAKTDNEDTLKEMGAVNLGLPRTVSNNKLLAFSLDLIGVIRACILLRKGDVLFLQYPVKKYFSFLCNVARMKGAKTVSLIHDLGSFRRKRLSIQKEINRLSHSDYVIASNENMAAWLKEHGMKKSVGALGLFDYRAKSFNRNNERPATANKTGVVYAGALSMHKNSFLVELTKSLSTWNLTVIGNKEGLQGLQENPHINYRGFMPSEEFIAHANASFGLVWDGNSLDTCSGEYGTYLRWNSPHKVSFNLRAGLPVIVWKESAVAPPIVQKYNVGIAIESLKELDRILPELSQEAYSEMKRNAVEMAKRLNEGYFLKEALRIAVNAL